MKITQRKENTKKNIRLKLRYTQMLQVDLEHMRNLLLSLP